MRYSRAVPMKRVVTAVALGALLLAKSADAADSRREAVAAYDRAAAAYDAGDFARAAAEFTRADELAPNETTLKVGLDAALRADDPVLGMSLAERAEGRAVHDDVRALIRALQKKFAARVGRLSVRCDAPRLCTAKLDASPIPVREPRWVSAGVHAVELSVDGRAEEHAVRVAAGDSVEVRPGVESPPPSTVEPRATSPVSAPSSGLSPTWFWVGVGLTAAAGVATVASAIDTGNQHSAYVRSPSEQGSLDGASAQRRTNVLLGATAAGAVITTAVGVFFTRWSPPSVAATMAVSLDVQRSSPSLVISGSY